MGNKTTNRIPSGFPMLDLMAGGYHSGEMTVVRFLGHEFDAEIVQHFIERQAMNFAMAAMNIPTLFVSFQMSDIDITRSMMMDKYISLEKLAHSKIYIHGRKKTKPVPSVHELETYLKEYIPKYEIKALIIDGIENIIPGVLDDRESISRTIVLMLQRIASVFGLPVIVSDYDNVLEATAKDFPNLIEITLNHDINDRTQATIDRGNGSDILIEDIYAEKQSVGIELVRSTAEYYLSNGCLPEATDEFQSLINAAATIVCRIDKMLMQ